MIQDLINSIKVSLHERLSSPLLGPMFISFFAFNYRALMIIFSGETLAEKFSLLDAYLSIDSPENLLRLFILPTLFTTTYIFILPYPTKWVYIFTRNRQRELLDIRVKTESELPLTQREASQLRSKLYQLESHYQQILRQRDQEIIQLQTPQKSKEASADIQDSNEVKIWSDEFDKFIASQESTIFSKNLSYLYAGTLDFTKLDNFGDLAAWGIVEVDSDNTVYITEKGKYFAKRMKSLSAASSNTDKDKTDVQNKIKQLSKLFITLAKEKADFKKLNYNNSRINEFLKNNKSILEKHLDTEYDDLIELIYKNSSIINRIISSGQSSIESYLEEILLELKKYNL